MTAPTQIKLGWKPGPADPRTLRLANYLTPDLPAPPAASNWMKQVEAWPMLGNDRIGDCVLVSCAHLVQGWTRYATGAETLIPERDVIGAYSAITGYDPYTGANDDGTMTLDALKFWRKTGIGGRKIAAYVQVDHRSDAQVKTAQNLFGGVYIAAQLPKTALTQFDRRQTWIPAGGANGRRGSAGGHAMRLGAYGPTGITVSTWGRPQRATWIWWDSYVAECFAIVSTDWLDKAGGVNPLGFDLAAMLADLKRVAG